MVLKKIAALGLLAGVALGASAQAPISTTSS